MAELLCKFVSFSTICCTLDADQWTNYERLAPPNAADPLPVYE